MTREVGNIRIYLHVSWWLFGVPPFFPSSQQMWAAGIPLQWPRWANTKLSQKWIPGPALQSKTPVSCDLASPALPPTPASGLTGGTGATSPQFPFFFGLIHGNSHLWPAHSHPSVGSNHILCDSTTSGLNEEEKSCQILWKVYVSVEINSSR